MNFYKRYPADYGRKTARLTLAQHGAYTLLLDEVYSTEAPLPGAFDELYRICRAMSKPEQEAVRAVADKFFPLSSDGLRRNQRAEEEITEAAPAIEAARLNGKKGGRPKKETQKEPSGFSMGNPESTQNEPKSKAPHSSDNCSSLRSEQSRSFCGKSDDGYSPEFQAAWDSYPRRTGQSKSEAFKAWKARIQDGTTPEQMQAGATRYAAYCESNHTEARFVKHAATFFGPDRHFLNDWTPEVRAQNSLVGRDAPHKFAAATAAIYEGVFNE